MLLDQLYILIPQKELLVNKRSTQTLSEPGYVGNDASLDPRTAPKVRIDPMFALLIGRFIAGLFYLNAGLDNLMHLADKVGYAAYSGVPYPWISVPLASLLLVVGGLSILTGYRPEVGVAAIVIFLLPVNVYMHDFWNVADPQLRVAEMRSFLSNLGLAGSVLFLLAIPRPWAWSLEKLASGRRSAALTPSTAR